MRRQVEAVRDIGRRGPTGLGYLATASGRVPAFRRGVTGRWPLLHSGASRGAGTPRISRGRHAARERAKALVAG
jgi:hypothetical protein